MFCAVRVGCWESRWSTCGKLCSIILALICALTPKPWGMLFLIQDGRFLCLRIGEKSQKMPAGNKWGEAALHALRTHRM